MNQAPGGWGQQQGQGSWGGHPQGGPPQGWGPQYGQPHQPPRPPANNTGAIILAAMLGGLVAFSLLTVLAAKSIVAGVVMILAGVGAIVVCVKVKRPPMVRPLSGISAGVLVLSAAFGMTVKISGDRETRAACDRATYELTHIKGGSMPYDQAMSELERLTKEADSGIVACTKAGMLNAAAGLEAGKKELARQIEGAKVNARKAEEENQKAQVLASIAQRESSWSARRTMIRTNLNEATNAVNAGRWQEADAALQAAKLEIENMLGTSIEGTPEWTSLRKQHETLSARVEPQIARRRQKEAADEAQAAAIVAVTGKKPDERWFDGCNMRCRRAVIDSMNDPDSFSCITSTEPQIEGDAWTVVIAYRGKNAFNATVQGQSKCWIREGQVVKIK